MVRVWDPLVRLFHWSLVSSFVIAWFTPVAAATLHHWAGYAAVALVLLRVIWGIGSTGHARFSHFVRRPRTVFRYLADIARGKESRHIGHNPAGGAMVLALIIGMVTASISGYMMTTNRYFGIDWVETFHKVSVNGLLLLVVLHLGGVALASLHHRENLVRAMISGFKRAPEDTGDEHI
ncbi:MAG: cytochrome B [Alphaproteobacteria bacterium]|nr:cytochrome B [Alphaproteobacteria bacterium]